MLDKAVHEKRQREKKKNNWFKKFLLPFSFCSCASQLTFLLGGRSGFDGGWKVKAACRGSVYPYNWQTANLAADNAEYALAA